MEFVQFRRFLHQHPETSNREFQTTKLIKALAIKLGVREEQITTITETGLWIDLAGEAPPQGKDVCIAIRADIDALEMTETNNDLEYHSVNPGAAHMCGHDGHTASLAAAIPLFLQRAKEIPSNKHFRLIFQPAEESLADSGAEKLIKAGCLKGVDEIYGFHNHNYKAPLHEFGFFSCQEGAMTAAATTIKIKIKGTGGHGSEPESLKYALPKAIQFYSDIIKLERQLKEKHGNIFSIMFPLFKTGERYNVISETVTIQGAVRTFSNQLADYILEQIRNGLEKLKAEGFEVNWTHTFIGVTQNHKKQTENMIRVAKKLYGETIVGNFGLPAKGTEDFSLYLKQVPGALTFIGGADENHHGHLHSPNYNFNDKLIPYVSNYWMALLEDRFAQ